MYCGANNKLGIESNKNSKSRCEIEDCCDELRMGNKQKIRNLSSAQNVGRGEQKLDQLVKAVEITFEAFSYTKKRDNELEK